MRSGTVNVYTYPEDAVISVLIDSCDDIPQPAMVAESIRSLFGLQVPHAGLIYRPAWRWKRLRNTAPMPDTWPDLLRDVDRER